MADTLDYPRRSKRGEPVYELAAIEYPLQGYWTEEEYLEREMDARVEFVDGCLEFLPAPTIKHQKVLKFFFLLLHQFVASRKLGDVEFAGLRVRTSPRSIREPDVAFLSKDKVESQDKFAWKAADLVFEAVSGGPEDRNRDLVEKRVEYAKAGIPEYWIADYEKGVLLVLTLKGDTYIEHCVARRGDIARSKLLPGFEIKTADLLDAE